MLSNQRRLLRHSDCHIASAIAPQTMGTLHLQDTLRGRSSSGRENELREAVRGVFGGHPPPWGGWFVSPHHFQVQSLSVPERNRTLHRRRCDWSHPFQEEDLFGMQRWSLRAYCPKSMGMTWELLCVCVFQVGYPILEQDKTGLSYAKIGYCISIWKVTLYLCFFCPTISIFFMEDSEIFFEYIPVFLMTFYKIINFVQ